MLNRRGLETGLFTVPLESATMQNNIFNNTTTYKFNEVLKHSLEHTGASKMSTDRKKRHMPWSAAMYAQLR